MSYIDIVKYFFRGVDGEEFTTELHGGGGEDFFTTNHTNQHEHE